MKNLTAIMITLAMLCAVSCTEGTNTPAQTTATTVGSDAPIAPPETTATTAETTADTTETVTTEAETTAPVTEEPSLPEFDINSEECLMHRLIGMTVDEIEAEFGELTLYGIVLGGTPCYRLANLGIIIYFPDYEDVFNDPLPRDYTPWLIETEGYEGVIYPGIYEGMGSKELIDLIGIGELNYSIMEITGGFVSKYNFDDRVIRVGWDLSYDDAPDFIYEFYNGDIEKREPMLDDIAEKMRTGEIETKVGRIFISKVKTE